MKHHSVVNVMEGIHYQTGEMLAISLNNGRISSVNKSLHVKKDAPYIAPGLVDLQINGYMGYDFNTIPISIEDVKMATEELWKKGVTTYYPTVITNSDGAIEEAVRSIAKAMDTYETVAKSIAGIHVEGPFISPEDGPRGAHGREYVKAPDWDLFERWQEASGGRIKIITISPEWEGSSAFISKCVKSGVTVSIGHTAASVEQIQEAVESGATMSTHLGNGAHLMLPRHPNYIWEQLAEDNLTSFIIADGFHLPNSFLKVVMKVKDQKAMLVSDAVYLSGLRPGEYETHIGGKVVLTPDGKLHTAENPKILAGSAQILIHGIETLVNNDLATFERAWDMASIQPSKFMNLPTGEGITPGTPADLVLYEWKEKKVNVIETYKNGLKVFSSAHYQKY